MTELSDEARRALINDALEKKFGSLLNWQRPIAGYCVGPSDPAIYDVFVERRDSLVEQATSDLMHLSDQELLAIKSPQSEEDKVHSNWWRGYLRYDLPSAPPPMAFGFGHPSFKPDFGYWAQMPEFSLYELLVLSVGADPENITESEIEDWKRPKSRHHSPKKIWPAQVYLLKRFEQLRRYFSAGHWGFVPMSIREAKALIDEIELDVHPDFYHAVRARLQPKSEDANPATSEELSPTEKQTLLKLIAAMACEQYEFDPQKQRNTATGMIRDDLELIGQRLDDKTILKWLKEACQTVDPNYWKSS